MLQWEKIVFLGSAAQTKESSPRAAGTLGARVHKPHKVQCSTVSVLQSKPPNFRSPIRTTRSNTCTSTLSHLHTVVQEREATCPWAQSTTPPPGSPLPLSSPVLQHLDLRVPEPPSQLLAARTVFHLDNWAKITDSGSWMWSHDTSWTWGKTLHQSHYPVTVAQENQEDLIHQEVRTLLNKKAIVEVPPAQADDGFYSILFLVPKKEGQHRPVVNL